MSSNITNLEPPKNQFTAWKEDKLDRVKVADHLNSVIKNIEQPFLIAINATYGSGKTFFMKNWHRQMQEEARNVVFFNAWSSELTDDPIVALIAEIKAQIPKLASEDMQARLYQLLDIASPYIARKLPEEQNGENEGLNIARQKLQKHEKIMEAMQTFRRGLMSLVSELGEHEQHSDRQKVVILVDELDRCRPDYAIEILECLRHLFYVPGVVIVLAVDKKQLRNTIAGIYGGEASGEGYLRKFIDWELSFPEPPYGLFAKHLYVHSGVKDTGIFLEGRDPYKGEEHLIEGFAFFADMLNLTLRQQVHCFTEINLIAKQLKKDGKADKVFGFLLAAMVASKMAYSDHLSKYVFGYIPITDFLRELEEPGMETIKKYLRVSWLDFKMRLHAWFTTEEEAEIMRAEMSEIDKEINEMIESRVMNSRELPLKNRKHYLSGVLATYDQLDKNGLQEGQGSAAQAIYMDVEKASFLTA